MHQYEIIFVQDQIEHNIRLVAHSEPEAVQQTLNRFPASTDHIVKSLDKPFSIYVVDFQKKILLKHLTGNY